MPLKQGHSAWRAFPGIVMASTNDQDAKGKALTLEDALCLVHILTDGIFLERTSSSRPLRSFTYYITSDTNRNWSYFDQTSSTVVYLASPSKCKEKKCCSNKYIWFRAALWHSQHCNGVHQCPGRQGKGTHPPGCPLPCAHLDRWYFPWENFFLVSFPIINIVYDVRNKPELFML